MISAIGVSAIRDKLNERGILLPRGTAVSTLRVAHHPPPKPRVYDFIERHASTNSTTIEPPRDFENHQTDSGHLSDKMLKQYTFRDEIIRSGETMPYKSNLPNKF
jgi:hypothetical protein